MNTLENTTKTDKNTGKRKESALRDCNVEISMKYPYTVISFIVGNIIPHRGHILKTNVAPLCNELT